MRARDGNVNLRLQLQIRAKQGILGGSCAGPKLLQNLNLTTTNLFFFSFLQIKNKKQQNQPRPSLSSSLQRRVAMGLFWLSGSGER